MDELVKLVTQKTGISQDQAKQAIQTVIDFIKQKLPAPIASQIDGLLAGSAAGDVAKGIGNLFGK
jgi:nucleoid DNA-binding protein